MWTLGALAANPLLNVRRAISQLDAPVLAATQKTNRLKIDEADFRQIEDHGVVLPLKQMLSDSFEAIFLQPADQAKNDLRTICFGFYSKHGEIALARGEAILQPISFGQNRVRLNG
jgi:hypothetical protein